MGLAAMLAEANMRSNAGAGDQEENLEREMDLDEGDENETDGIMDRHGIVRHKRLRQKKGDEERKKSNGPGRHACRGQHEKQRRCG